MDAITIGAMAINRLIQIRDFAVEAESLEELQDFVTDRFAEVYEATRRPTEGL